MVFLCYGYRRTCGHAVNIFSICYHDRSSLENQWNIDVCFVFSTICFFFPPFLAPIVRRGIWDLIECRKKLFISYHLILLESFICKKILSFSKASELLTRLLGWTRLVGWTRLIRWRNRRRKGYNLGFIWRMLKQNSWCSQYQSLICVDYKYKKG